MTPPEEREGDPKKSFRRHERLRSRSEFQRAYREGTSYPGSLFVLIVLLSADLERKAGFVASRKVGGAVSRNRARRLMREAYRHHKHRVPIAGHQLVFVARKGCAEATFQEVETELLGLMKKAGL